MDMAVMLFVLIIGGSCMNGYGEIAYLVGVLYAEATFEKAYEEITRNGNKTEVFIV